MSRNAYATQGRLLIALLKRRRMTYGQMLAVGVSCSPWKRVLEGLRSGEKLIKAPNARGLTTWHVVPVRGWQA